DAWTLEQPGPYAADASAVRSLLSTLRSMRAVDFPSDQPTDLGTYGLDRPRMSVTLSLASNATQQLLVGKETEQKEVYLKTAAAPTVFTVNDWVLKDLSKKPTELRDKTVLAFDRDKASAVEIKRSDGARIHLVRGADKQWQIEGGDGKPADAVISQYLGDVHDLKGYEIAADHPTD